MVEPDTNGVKTENIAVQVFEAGYRESTRWPKLPLAELKYAISPFKISSRRQADPAGIAVEKSSVRLAGFQVPERLNRDDLLMLNE